MRILKRLILIVTMLFLAEGVANAEFRFGIKAGLDVNKLHFNEGMFSSDNRTGFTGGIMTEFTVPVIGIGFDLSLMYTRMNSEAFSDDRPGEVRPEGTLGKDFLQIPLNLKYKMSLPVVSSFLKPMIFTGPSFNFRLDSSTWSAFKEKRCQVAWNLGVGVELIRHLQVSASYAWGMNNLAKKVGVNAQNIDLKNNYWTVTAAWLF